MTTSGIPIHRLQEDAKLNIDIIRFDIGNAYGAKAEEVHRDDHYVFLLFEWGTATLKLDFQEIAFQKSCAFYILPGQVHHHLRNQKAQGWYVAVDTLLVPVDHQTVFDHYLGIQQPLYLDAQQLNQCRTILQLLTDRNGGAAPSPFQNTTTLSLLQAFTGIIAGGYSALHEAAVPVARPWRLTYEFRKLVVTHFRSWKGPAGYADHMNVSTGYLNDVVKKTTGFPAGHWITQQALLEAKRLLSHTTIDISEVAYRIGYPDSAYFSKWFKKHGGISPSVFRGRNRE